MRVNVIGLSKFNYGEKKSKQGMTLHCTRKDSRTEGLSVKMQTLYHEQVHEFPDVLSVKVGDEINLDYDDNKYLCGLEIIHPVQAATTSASGKQTGFFGK